MRQFRCLHSEALSRKRASSPTKRTGFGLTETTYVSPRLQPSSSILLHNLGIRTDVRIATVLFSILAQSACIKLARPSSEARDATLGVDSLITFVAPDFALPKKSCHSFRFRFRFAAPAEWRHGCSSVDRARAANETRTQALFNQNSGKIVGNFCLA